MKYKSIIILVLAVFLLSMSSVCASEIDDTIASDDTNDIRLSADDEIEDNLQTNDENSELTLTDTDILGADSATYSDLAAEIAQSGNIKLKHKNYTYDTGATTINIAEENKVIDGDGAVIDMAGSSSMQAFYAVASGVTIKNLTIKNANHQGNGGAIYFSSSGTVTDCNFTNNTAYNGGAVYFNVDGNVSNCNFINNHAYRYGGAVYFNVDGNVSNCNFTNNSATAIGGAIRFLGEGNVSNCNFIDNSAYNGGAVYFYNKNGGVINCNFINNTATDNGGAIRFYDGGAVLNCNFTNNTSIVGGAIASRIFNAVTVDTCIFKTSSDTTDNILLDPGLDINVDDVTEGSNATIRITTNSTFNGVVTVIIGDKTYPVTLVNGIGSCNVSGLKAGNYNATVIFNQTDKFQATNKTTNFTVKNKLITIIKSSAVTTTYATSKNIIITLTDKQGRALASKKVSVVLNGVSKMLTTNNKGQVTLATGTTVVPKTYKVSFNFAGDNIYLGSSGSVNLVVKKSTPKITAKKKTFVTSVKTKKYKIVLKDETGKAIKNAKVTLKVNGIKYIAKTNSKGKAVFKIKKLNKKGTYKAKVTYKGNKYYKKLSKKVKIKVNITFKTVAKGSKDKSTVKKIQQALKGHGYYLSYKGHYLIVDGKYKSCTKRSVKEFQHDNGLKITGKVDKKTAKKLSII